MFVEVKPIPIFATCMLREDFLLKELVKALVTDKFANEVKVSLNNSSKEKNRADLS